MRSHATEPRPSPALLAAYWLGIQCVWGALLAISLQARSSELAPGAALGAYGILATSGALVASVVQILAGIASDRRRRSTRDRVAFYVGGAVVGAAGVVWFYLAPSFASLVAAYALVQLGLNVAMAAYQPVIPDVVAPGRTGSASSWMAAFQSAGNAIGAVVAAKAADGRVAAAAIVALLLAGCATTARHVARLPLREAGEGGVAAPRGAFAALFVSRALVYVGFFTLLGFLFFYVREATPGALASAKTTSGFMVLAFTLAGALGAALAARPSDRRDKRSVATLGGAGVIAALIALIATHDAGAAFGATAFAGAAWGVFLVADWALACRVVPSSSLATSLAIWNLAIVAPQIVAPALATFALSRVGALGGLSPSRLAFALACIEIVLGLLSLWRLPSSVARNNGPGLQR